MTTTNWLEPQGTPIKWADVREDDIVEWDEGDKIVRRGSAERRGDRGMYIKGWGLPRIAATITLVHRLVVEPTNLGAIVDAGGARFVRAVDDGAGWARTKAALGGRWHGWDDITALGPVTVISEGVAL